MGILNFLGFLDFFSFYLVLCGQNCIGRVEIIDNFFTQVHRKLYLVVKKKKS